MKNLGLFFMILVPIFCCAQVNESFSDGNFINNPIWTGDVSNFTVNSNQQLQSNVSIADTSSLFTASESIDNATWECWVKMTINPSSTNNASVIIVSDRTDISKGFNGYFVQVGGSPDEVSLFLQQGTKKTRIISGIDNRTSTDSVKIQIKVTRNAQGWFELLTKLSTDNDFVSVGTVQNLAVKSSSYFGLRFINTKTSGYKYYFDDIVVTGDKTIDKEAPKWTSFVLEQPNTLKLGFSEAMDFSKAAFGVSNAVGNPSSQVVSVDKLSVTLSFNTDFEKGKIYCLEVSGLTDLSGNALAETSRCIGIVEPKDADNLIINEIMVENPVGSLEYIEIFNRSEKLLDLSGMILATRKTDGSLNTGIKIPASTTLLPKSYLALCENADSVRNYHRCPAEANILSTEWSPLNNEKASLVLTNATKDTIYDELSYNVSWHHALVKNPKGVALERINPDLPTQDPASWHSAASEVNYGTPGYKNSQYRSLDEVSAADKFVWADPEAFTPDNDGVNDICMIHYKTDTNGFVANALILTPNGEKVFHLVSNQLLSTEGMLSWDGRTDKGKNVNAGIYVLYFEMFNPQTGARKQSKLPIVVSFR